METTTCKHKPTSRSLVMGANVEECTLCHQQVKYTMDRYQSSHPTIIKLGRIGDKIVPPDPSHKLELGAQDALDLQSATGPAGPEAKPELNYRSRLRSSGELMVDQVKPTARPKDTYGKMKWFKNFKKAMIHDLVKLGDRKFVKAWEKFGANNHMLPHLKKEKLYLQLKAEAEATQAAAAESKPSPKPSPKSKRKTKVRQGAPPPPPLLLPSLPDWNEDWPTPVKIQWLEAYKAALPPKGVIDVH